MAQNHPHIVIASDHAGYSLKEIIKAHLSEKGYEFTDYGTDSENSTDYPDHIHPLASDVDAGKFSTGIIMCGSGNGVSMTANKYQGVRAALCWTPIIARLAKAHNNANILALPARFVDEKTAIEIVDAYLNSSFEGGRHQVRVEKIRIS